MFDPPMPNRPSLFQRSKNFFLDLWQKLSRIDDTPEKIAAGFGLGVFAGILPGIGPVAATLMAILLRVNKIAAFFGALLTNTWLSFITLILSIKIGSLLTGSDWQRVYAHFKDLFKDFHFKKLWDTSIDEVLVPTAIGFFIVGLTAGLLSALGVLFFLKQYKKKTSSTPSSE